MVGYVSFRVEDGKGDDEQNAKTLHPLPKDADLELYHMYFGGRARKEKEHMAGLKYACEFISTPSTTHAPIEVQLIFLYSLDEPPRTTSIPAQRYWLSVTSLRVIHVPCR